MRIKERFRLIFLNLIQNKFKTVLTSLGIVVGVLTIVLVIAIGMGAEKEAEKQFSGLSADTIYVKNNYSLSEYGMEKLSQHHLDMILKEGNHVKMGYIRSSLFLKINASGTEDYYQGQAVTKDYSATSNLQIEFGRDMSETEHENGDNVLVLGNGYAQKFFETAENAVGKTLFMRGTPFLVVGVLKRNADGMQGLSPDENFFLPMSTGLNQNFVSEYSYPTMVLKANDVKSVQLAMKEIQYTLDYFLSSADSHVIEDAGSRIESATAQARLMKTILISIALIVFLVGGIGIMNVMFITIKERTKEIGVLKALGFTEKSILGQFLIESGVIGLISGAVGILLSVIALAVFSQSGIAIHVDPWGKIIAMIFAVVTSLLFGYYPSYKASKLEPVLALS